MVIQLNTDYAYSKKLTPQDVANIREIHREYPEIGQKYLAKVFGVSQVTISAILTYKIWKTRG